jgi:hypothetical protein
VEREARVGWKGRQLPLTFPMLLRVALAFPGLFVGTQSSYMQNDFPIPATAAEFKRRPLHVDFLSLSHQALCFIDRRLGVLFLNKSSLELEWNANGSGRYWASSFCYLKSICYSFFAVWSGRNLGEEGLGRPYPNRSGAVGGVSLV